MAASGWSPAEARVRARSQWLRIVAALKAGEDPRLSATGERALEREGGMRRLRQVRHLMDVNQGAAAMIEADYIRRYVVTEWTDRTTPAARYWAARKPGGQREQPNDI